MGTRAFIKDPRCTAVIRADCQRRIMSSVRIEILLGHVNYVKIRVLLHMLHQRSGRAEALNCGCAPSTVGVELRAGRAVVRGRTDNQTRPRGKCRRRDTNHPWKKHGSMEKAPDGKTLGRLEPKWLRKERGTMDTGRKAEPVPHTRTQTRRPPDGGLRDGALMI